MKHFNELFHKNIIQKVTIYGSVITLTGTDGTADITINDIPNKVSATFLTDLTTTAHNWVVANIEHYEYHGYSISDSLGVISVTPKSDWDTVNRINATISNLTEDLSGTLTGVFEPDFSKADIWDVTFTMNSTIANPRNPRDGDKMDLILVGTGSYTLSWGDVWVSDNSITTIDTNIVTIKVRQVDGLSYAKSSFSWQTDWTTLTSGLIIYRKGIRSGFYVIDYSADGGVTWELDLVKLETDEDSIIINIDNGVEGYRHEVRGDAYCIDAELTATGFDGIRGSDWENIFIIGSEITFKYGALYNWYAVNDAREIANTGWHVISSLDYVALYNFCGGANQGGKLCENNADFWNDPSWCTNIYGLNLRGGGRREGNGGFNSLKEIFYSWIREPVSSSEAYCWGIYSAYFQAQPPGTAYISKRYGCSICLVRDSTNLSHGQSGIYTGNDGKVYRTICIGTQELLAGNLAETKYRDGSDIPIVTDDAAWAALATGAMCYYNNDINNALM